MFLGKNIYIKNKFRFTLFMTITFILILFILNTIFTYKVEGMMNENIEKNDNNYKVVIVKKGDTLWDIVGKDIDEKYDIRDEIYFVKKLNNLSTSYIYPGQEIIVPIRE